MIKSHNEEARKYVAFISYSHDDQPLARKFHRKLEALTLPVKLADGRRRRFRPVFLDEAEMTAGGVVSEKIKSAIDVAENLIVLCSPATPLSDYVRLEIDYFLSNNSADKVFVVIAAGQMNRSKTDFEDIHKFVPEGLLRAYELSAVSVSPIVVDRNSRVTKAAIHILAKYLRVSFPKVQQLQRKVVIRRAVPLVSIAFVGAYMLGTFWLQHILAAESFRQSEIEGSELSRSVTQKNSTATELTDTAKVEKRKQEEKKKAEYFATVSHVWELAITEQSKEAQVMLKRLETDGFAQFRSTEFSLLKAYVGDPRTSTQDGSPSASAGKSDERWEELLQIQACEVVAAYPTRGWNKATPLRVNGKLVLAEFEDFKILVVEDPMNLSSQLICYRDGHESPIPGAVPTPRLGKNWRSEVAIHDSSTGDCFFACGEIVCCNVDREDLKVLQVLQPSDQDVAIFEKRGVIIIPNADRVLIGSLLLERSTGTQICRIPWRSIPVLSNIRSGRLFRSQDDAIRRDSR